MRFASTRPVLLVTLIGCAGGGPDTDPPLPGSLRIVEYQAGIVSAGGPWVEVENRSDATASLVGVELTVGDLTVPLDEAVDLEPGALFVVGTTAARDAGVPVDLVADGLAIVADGTRFSLSSADVELQAFATDATWPTPVGASVGMEPGWTDPADPTGWCDGRTVGGGGDFGTPGEGNDSCECTMPFTYRYASVSGSASDVLGDAAIALGRDGMFAVEGESGAYTRWTDSAGQHLEWVYPTTGIGYSGTRPFGTGPYTDQPIAIPPEITGFASGTWSATGPCE